MRHALPGARWLLAGVLGLWGCGGGGGGGGNTPTSPSSPLSGATTVTTSIIGAVGNGAYTPNPVMARSGDTVVFRNSDTQLHHIVLDNGGADLGDVAPGATSRGLVLTNTNELRFHCTLHASMVGSINGSAAPDPPCIDQSGYSC
jgi:plastocyanin